MTKCMLIVQLEIPKTHYNSFRPSAQIGQFFGIFLKIALITCPLSMAHKEARCISLQSQCHCDNGELGLAHYKTINQEPYKTASQASQ